MTRQLERFVVYGLIAVLIFSFVWQGKAETDSTARIQLLSGKMSSNRHFRRLVI